MYTYAYNNPLIYIDPSGNIGIRQIDNFAMGLLASGIEGITDLIELPTATREISKAISQGQINLNDLAKAIGSSATEPIRYLIKHSSNVWLGKPTDAEVYQYAKHLGNIIQMVYSNGGKALSMFSKASPSLMKVVSKSAGSAGSNGLSKINDFVDLTAHRRDHILNRHKAGAGKAGKTEFPGTWTDDRILHQVSDIATDPSAIRGVGKWDSPYAIGVRDGVRIRVDFYPGNHPKYAGMISTAYPIP